MRVRRTNVELAATGDQDVRLLTQAIAQLFTRLRRLDIAGYFYVIVLAFVGTGGGNVRQNAFGVHAAVT